MLEKWSTIFNGWQNQKKFIRRIQSCFLHQNPEQMLQKKSFRHWHFAAASSSLGFLWVDQKKQRRE
jgi:hypothetical protein